MTFETRLWFILISSILFSSEIVWLFAAMSFFKCISISFSSATKHEALVVNLLDTFTSLTLSFK